jgi:hypothetical protein
VAQSVVDLFEAVEVEQQEGKAPRAPSMALANRSSALSRARSDEVLRAMDTPTGTATGTTSTTATTAPSVRGAEKANGTR